MFLDSIPDAALGSVAMSGKLPSSGVPSAHVKRLMASPTVKKHLTATVARWMLLP